jgi:hypothetical protein
LTRFSYDALLITAFMYRWRPETHMFHFLVGEMTFSLENVAMLGGLSCAGEVMGPIDIPATWHADFFARFAKRQRRACPSPTPTGPPGLGSSSSAYMIVTLIFNVCMHLKQM